MGWTLETILSKFAVGTSPLVRQASCVWLLTVLKLAGKHPDVQVLILIHCISWDNYRSMLFSINMCMYVPQILVDPIIIFVSIVAILEAHTTDLYEYAN